ncbi:tRNA (5-methylaminomethyl-2-thiouridine)(34)-methyltransferase MnmD [Fulvivirga lutimaris]|uniref:tRNA (5-methylaminomethyl-2-thiouridine)(34)-methyltransferase MnmD n=1 Tax=Fulvivirga lutimaris TaxID=1819566 RepID=UPI0012BCD991|nr:tRNA (5-methylaminomethyl-2-thiouridine)(34)-methyltransferase MnmD [Fulvivirga lutimaris]MTI41782.1 methyltransferase [Fulvivirga lutimaris]
MPEDNIKIIFTEDGSHSLYNAKLNETYHSFHGAIQESRHVFVKNGLDYHNGVKENVNVFELGFGTGLNALLAAEWALQNEVYITYDTIEAYPISEKQVSMLNYTSLIKGNNIQEWFDTLHKIPWNELHKVSNFFSFKKVHDSITQHTLPLEKYDVIFFDAFAPNKQSEMWEMDILTKIYDSMRPEGAFVTYCAQGQLKRNLKSLNLDVQTLPGPPGKKEMVRAVKNT